jgi:uncharacterized spore protein YtfJ
VESVFGEPIHTEGKTVIPVARVGLGFGAGSGSRPARTGGDGSPEGGGGGGGGRVYPVGALEITADRTRFIPIVGRHWIAAAFLAGFWLGSRRLFRRRRPA